MKKLTVIATLVVLFLAAGYYLYLLNWAPATTPVPGTTRTATAQEGVRLALAAKYGKPLSEVKVNISKEDGNFAGGGITFGEGGPGETGAFLARKTGNTWEVTFDGNGNVDCQKMRTEYGFPDTVLKPNFCD